MGIKTKGRTRYVLVFPKLGIVIKFPIVYLRHALQPFFRRGIDRKKKLEYLKEYLMWSSEIRYSFRWFLFGGLIANWREASYYLKTRNPFLQPIYFSLFGLLNIQRYGEPYQPQEEDSFSHQLYELTDGMVRNDIHHFYNPGNFCFSDGGTLQIIDYGTPRTQRIIEKHGKKIMDEFDPTIQ